MRWRPPGFRAGKSGATCRVGEHRPGGFLDGLPPRTAGLADASRAAAGCPGGASPSHWPRGHISSTYDRMARNVGRPPSAGAAQDEGTQKAPERRLRAALGLHSLAGQVFVLQVVIVLLLVAVALVEQVAQSRHDSTSEARNRS